jgi:hypothetical protein
LLSLGKISSRSCSQTNQHFFVGERRKRKQNKTEFVRWRIPFRFIVFTKMSNFFYPSWSFCPPLGYETLVELAT